MMINHIRFALSRRKRGRRWGDESPDVESEGIRRPSVHTIKNAPGRWKASVWVCSLTQVSYETESGGRMVRRTTRELEPKGSGTGYPGGEKPQEFCRPNSNGFVGRPLDAPGPGRTRARKCPRGERPLYGVIPLRIERSKKGEFCRLNSNESVGCPLAAPGPGRT